MIDSIEYNRLCEFIKKKSSKLFDHENGEATLSRRDFFIGKIAQANCFGRTTDEGHTRYFCFTNSFRYIIENFEHFIRKYCSEIQQEDAIIFLRALRAFHHPDMAFERYIDYLRQEQCCYVAELTNEGFIDSILRVDLFRKIEKQRGSGIDVFTGGLFHALKHFKLKDLDLMGSHNQCSIDSLFHIIEIISSSFINAMTNPIFENNDLIGRIPIMLNNHSLKVVFYHEQESEVYFIRTSYLN